MDRSDSRCEPIELSNPNENQATVPDNNAATDPAARLLAAAGPVFAQRGFDRATVREIAGIADVNVAAVSYYFRDKMGLYQAVIRAIRGKREREFPAPVVGQATPEETLRQIVHTLLCRMLSADDSGWEAMLMMRELQHPTEVLQEMIQEYFRPIYDSLVATLEAILSQCENETPDSRPSKNGSISSPPNRNGLERDGGSWRSEALTSQLAFGIVGQCLYHQIGRPVIQQLVDDSIRQQHYDPESLCRHITSMALASCSQQNVLHHRQKLEADNLAVRSVLNSVSAPRSKPD